VIETSVERAVVRPRARLRVPLEAEGRPVAALDALQGAVEQGAVRDLHSPAALLVHGEAVVLAGDHDLARAQVLHRVVGAVVAEFHLFGARAAGQGQQLVAQADTEQGNLRVEQFADRIDGVVAGFRIAGAVGEEDAVGTIARTSSAGVCAGTTVTRSRDRRACAGCCA
jgi:hypothetical protein